MKFKIGDFVRFVDEPIEGHITSFQNNDIIGVTDDSGFEIPVPANKITLVHGNMRRDDDETTETKITATHAPFVDRGIYLGIAGEQKDGLAKFFFINHTSYDILIIANEINGTKRTGIFAEKILASDFVQFYSANFTNIGKWPNFEIQILRYSVSPHNATPILHKEFRVKPLDLLHTKENDHLLGIKVWRYELDKPEENIGLDKLKDHFISHRPNQR
ncbi:hypothetical protein [Sphingobacterium corticibacterium]|uniref:Uncharacterized protein n=1 Tax=Sphingobacterium corticibacterium TaxID=2484746 RepID=A0A4Q6XMS5_9SPHI|nr:hypothetical protein [Sphingobacterium corticibacterium]RZF58564.1 hypothetical protein EWE74_18365 [Sphingobacterium corticibacterium]